MAVATDQALDNNSCGGVKQGQTELRWQGWLKSMVTDVEEDNDDGEGDKATTRMSKHPTP